MGPYPIFYRNPQAEKAHSLRHKKVKQSAPAPCGLVDSP